MSTRRITEIDIEKARSTSILDIAQRLGGDPVPRGSEFVACCPLHQDSHPSLSLNAEQGVWYCFVCGVGGDSIKLTMEAKGLGFVDAVRWIVGR